tara:strand:+ start:514 stop:705 length:192 start_codon:yes stop_codon:yes gene_type:complete
LEAVQAGDQAMRVAMMGGQGATVSRVKGSTLDQNLYALAVRVEVREEPRLVRAPTFLERRVSE